MHILQVKRGLIHKKDCKAIPANVIPGVNGWIEVPKEVTRLFALRMAPQWNPPHRTGYLGCCMRCKPHE